MGWTVSSKPLLCTWPLCWHVLPLVQTACPLWWPRVCCLSCCCLPPWALVPGANVACTRRVVCLWCGAHSALELPAVGMSGTIPDALSVLTTLTKLDLGGNALTVGVAKHARLHAHSCFAFWYLPIVGVRHLGLRCPFRQSPSTNPSPVVRATTFPFVFLVGHPALALSSPQGSIPASFSGLANLVLFNVSANQLSGTLPAFGLVEPPTGLRRCVACVM